MAADRETAVESFSTSSLEQELKRRFARNASPDPFRDEVCEVSGARLGRAPGFDLDHLFTYHAPNARQLTQYEAIRTAAKYFATVLLQNTPACADQSDAIRKLRETVMTANASIALDGRQ
jgi:hypothetical protein